MNVQLSVREMQFSDVLLIADYWLTSDHSFLKSMGVDVNKLPSREALTTMLTSQLHLPLERRRSYCIIWETDGVASGHCNINPATFGEEAYMHLHLWKQDQRQRGLGTELIALTLPFFFYKLKLQCLYSQPYSLNEAPNKTLKKAGFELVKEYITVPGSLNFEQPVKQWRMTAATFRKLYKK